MSKSGVPKIIIDNKKYQPSNKLENKKVVITGGDSGIGAATAILFAKEGADIIINYLAEDKDAKRVIDIIREIGKEAYSFKGDIGTESVCADLAKFAKEKFGQIDILINNAGTQVVKQSVENISEAQLLRTFKTNIFSMFYLTQECIKLMISGSCIINTTSVTAYRGSPQLLDYSPTKGAIVSFTRSLSQNLAKESIRVNGVAPGPVWTDLVTSSFDNKKLSKFGNDQPLGRAAQPYEIAPAFLFLASNDSAYMTGQVLHVNGGEIING